MIIPDLLELFKDYNADIALVNVRCIMCSTLHTIPIHHDEAIKYINGALIQVAFPDLTDDQRDMLMTGICGKCFNDMFKPN